MFVTHVFLKKNLETGHLIGKVSSRKYKIRDKLINMQIKFRLL